MDVTLSDIESAWKTHRAYRMNVITSTLSLLWRSQESEWRHFPDSSVQQKSTIYLFSLPESLLKNLPRFR
jgi:hypothetical protein